MEETMNTTENTGLVEIDNDSSTELVPVDDESEESGSAIGKLILVGIGAGIGILIPKAIKLAKEKLPKKTAKKDKSDNKKFDKYYRVIQDTNGKVISQDWVDKNGNEIKPEKK